MRKWDKLKQPIFTTFQYRRKDAELGRDWHNGKTLKIVYHPRHEYEYLGIARVISKETKQCQMITEEEAVADGFEDVSEMMDFLKPQHSFDLINKLTLKWIEGFKKVEAK
jgi:hypothetical protein